MQNLHLDDALSRFQQAASADPGDSASYRAVAATYLWKIAFHRGAVTSDDFLGDEVRADALDMPKPPPELAESFQMNADRALRLAEQHVQDRPDDADAHYQLGAAIALLASYQATVDGHVFAAFRLARRAYQENDRALAIDPSRKDAGLVVGAYQYIVSTRALPVRFLARLSGLEGNKTHGIALIETAAHYPGENQTDAQLALVLIYNREHRYDEALTVLAHLQTRYPDNRLLWLEAGAAALRANRFQEALRSLDSGFVKWSDHRGLSAFGEEALWHYKRGAALVGLEQGVDATAELRAALQHAAPEWVHGRAHVELGKIAERLGKNDVARQEYESGVQLAKAGKDSIGLKDAEVLLAKSSHR